MRQYIFWRICVILNKLGMMELSVMEKLAINNFLRHLRIDCGLKKEVIVEMINYAKQKKLSFITYLIHAKKIDSNYLAQLLAKEFLLTFIDLDTIDPSQLPIHLINENLLEQYQILPLWQDNEKLGLAMVDPSHQVAIDDVRFSTGLILEYIVVEAKQLTLMLGKLRNQSMILKQTSCKLGLRVGSKSRTEDVNIPPIPLNNTTEDEVAIINYVCQLLLYAIARNASDVHFEPYQEHLEIRFRIDGLLYVMVVLPKYLIQRIITRLKIMSQLDIAERRVPQDGRFRIQDAKGRDVDCRLTTCPTIYGEKLVIRILDTNKMLLEIDKLGMNEVQKYEFLQALNSPHGMILVTGPTGSGKTITLYTALNFLKKSTVNISSVENPVEIILPGINQVNVNSAVGLNFSCVLRAFLRQDPDIIMVGEMRDQETAEIGIKAAQTGHLVLSTLHTNSAAESLIRLANMGIPTYNIAASVHLIVAQRLVRRLCIDCKVEDKLPEKVLYKLGLIDDEKNKIKIFSSRGCSKCTDGYRGRTGIFEILTLTDEIRKLILQENSALEISLLARKTGMQTLYLSALAKLKQGEISLLEMKRVTKD